MLGAQLVRGRSRPANHDRHTDLPSGHVADLRRIVHDLIHRKDREVKGHHLDDGVESGHGGADRQAGKSQFGDRRIYDAPRAELFQEPLADLEGALIIGDILADQEDLLVAPHLFPQSLVERFPIGKGHEYTSSARASTAGTGLVSAKSTASSTIFLTSCSRVLKSASAAPRSFKSLVLSRSNGSRFFASSTSLLVR